MHRNEHRPFLPTARTRHIASRRQRVVMSGCILFLVLACGFAMSSPLAVIALMGRLVRQQGSVVITMDADLQDSPDEIPALFKMITEEGYDLVSGWKQKRYDPLSKTIPTKLFNATARKVSGIPNLHDFNCGLKAYRQEVVKNIEVYGEMHRYIPYLAKEAGFDKIGAIAPRRRGQIRADSFLRRPASEECGAMYQYRIKSCSTTTPHRLRRRSRLANHQRRHRPYAFTSHAVRRPRNSRHSR